MSGEDRMRKGAACKGGPFRIVRTARKSGALLWSELHGSTVLSLHGGGWVDELGTLDDALEIHLHAVAEAVWRQKQRGKRLGKRQANPMREALAGWVATRASFPTEGEAWRWLERWACAQGFEGGRDISTDGKWLKDMKRK